MKNGDEVSTSIKILKPKNKKNLENEKENKQNKQNIKESFIEIFEENENDINFLQKKYRKNFRNKEAFFEKKINEIKDFNKEEKNFTKKLDEVLFKNIEESRLIYKKIQLFGDLLIDAVKGKTLCDKDIDGLKEENLLLKSVIAKNEIKKSRMDNGNVDSKKVLLKDNKNSLNLNLNKEKKR